MNTASFYNRIAPFYPAIDWVFGLQKKRLRILLEALPPGELADLGVGDGSTFPAYDRHRITGVDASAKMLQQAQKKAPKSAILLQADLHELPFPESHFDYVVLSHVIATVNHPGQVLAEAARVLKPGGKLFVLNHFTPSHALGIVDWAFQPVGKWFRFRTVFREKDLPLPTVFRKLDSYSWLGGYFKLLVYEKKPMRE